MISVAVCIASYNRRQRTLDCLERLFAAALPDNCQLVVHLLDDASSDGTASAVTERFPEVRLHQGDGNCYWAGGMRIAYDHARQDGHDFFVWLNDDVELADDAIMRAWKTYGELKDRLAGEHVIAGAMHGVNGETTYGGFVRSSRLLPWKFGLAAPFPDQPRECHTLNGNFVFFSREVARMVGGIDKAFVQMHADLVLGLKARRKGARVWLMAGHAGICEANVGGRKNWKTPGLSFGERIRLMQHPLGYPLRPSIAYARNFGLWAPVMVVAPYVGLLSSVMFGSGKKKRP